MKPVVFLGPSLPHDEAARILDADYRPPVKRRDLQGLPEDVTIVGIIDGVLMNEASVGHREILSLLEKGVTVIGGGSMGALRSAELQDFGMIGVGVIYEMYRDGKIDGDDEVVLMYDPHTLKPLSEPLINIRLNLDDAANKEVITPEQSSNLVAKMKDLYFPQRSYVSLMRYAEASLDRPRYITLKRFIESSRKDQKENDAKMVLSAVKSYFEIPENLTLVNR